MFVGRVAERADVHRALDRSGAVVIRGAPGAGKSALARAVLAERGPFAELGGLRFTAHVALAPVARLLRVVPDSGPDATASRVVAHLAGRSLLLDDLQWIDHDTREVIGRLIGIVPLVATSRATQDDDDPTLDAFEHLTLEPLSPSDAVELARAVHPHLDDHQLDALIATAQGSPLLLHELVADAGPSATLTSALLPRVAALEPAALEALQLIVLLGRPLALDKLDPATERPAVDAVIDAGLVVVRDGLAAIRHPLLGEAVAEQLTEAQRRQVHRRLAERVASPGDRARHLIAAGDLDAARACALAGAGSAAGLLDRAELLLLAAPGAPEALREAERVAAAQLLLDGGAPHRVTELLSDLPGTLSPVERAERALLVSAANWNLARSAEAASWMQLALAYSRGTESAVEARALALSTVLNTRVAFERRDSLAVATRAVELAESLGIDTLVPTARLGSVQLLHGDERWRATLEDVVEAAGRSGAPLARAQAGLSLVLGLWVTGQSSQAAQVARLEAEAARRDGIAAEWPTLEGYAVTIELQLGHDPIALAARGTALLDDVAVFRARAFAATATAVALGEAGDVRGAHALLDGITAHARRDPQDRSLLAWAAAELACRYDDFDALDAAAAIARDAGVGGFPSSVIAQVLHAHGLRRRGQAVTGPPPSPQFPGWAPAVAEWEALCRAHDDVRGAIAGFDAAAAAWADFDRRSQRRCLLAAAELARAAGTDDAAEREAAVAVGAPTVRRRAARGARRRIVVNGFALTPRQAELMALVAQGATTAAIARELGIRATTVESHIRAVIALTGATGRRDAVLRLADASTDDGANP